MNFTYSRKEVGSYGIGLVADTKEYLLSVIARKMNKRRNVCENRVRRLVYSESRLLVQQPEADEA